MFENIYNNTCERKNTLKYIKYYLKTKNNYLKKQSKHPLITLIRTTYSIKITLISLTPKKSSYMAKDIKDKRTNHDYEPHFHKPTSNNQTY